MKSRCSRGRARLAELLAPLLDAATVTAHDTPARNPVAAAPVEPTDAPRGPPPVAEH